MKRIARIILALCVLICIAFVGLDSQRRHLLQSLSSKGTLSKWRILGAAGWNVATKDFPFAYPSEIVIEAPPDDPSEVAKKVWSLPGIDTVRIYIREQTIAPVLFQGSRDSSVRVLDLDGAMLNDEAISQISGNQSLEELILTGSSINKLPNFIAPKLRVLDVAQTAIRDDSLSSLRNLAALETLDLSGTALSNLEFSNLSNLVNLKHLYLADTQVPQEQVDSLKKQMPSVRIYR